MRRKECIAMLLAGGQGSRLGALTKNNAKPAVSFGGKYRIIDFSLSNCANSKIRTVGVLTQYRPLILNSYIGTGAAWDLDDPNGGVSILPPFATEKSQEWYKGTADAVYQNFDYINMNNPEHILILSGDHLYSMNYRLMLKEHIKNNADLTISVMRVPWEEASRFGIITANEDGTVSRFTEKPKEPDSDLASMGVYIFKRDTLEKALKEDAGDLNSEHDFGKNIIPKLLAQDKRLYCYEFSGYWKDVGTISSYHETSMELLEKNPNFDLFDHEKQIMSNVKSQTPHYIGESAKVDTSIVGDGSTVLGSVKHSIISVDCFIGKDAIVEDSVLLPGAKVMAGAKVTKSILGEEAVISENVILGGADPEEDIVVIGDSVVVTGKEKNNG